MMRTFVAVEISDRDITNSIKEFQSQLNIKAKPVEPQNFHFTLQFLGEISDDVSKKIILALNSIKFSCFKVNLIGVGVFPNPKFPRVVWIGTNREGGDKLIDLAKKVQKVLEPLGFSPDKPFKPHITIFRIKKKIENIGNELEEHKMREFGTQEITCIKFKKSELTPSGSNYSDLMEIKGTV